MKEALLWKKLDDNINCFLCSHRCVIGSGKRGRCMVREHRSGKLYSLVYGKIVAAHIDPVEKKPLYHFYPGHASFSIASVGCNFTCLFCQNADIAQLPHDHKGKIVGRDFTPNQIVDEALATQCQTISYTYTEPTIWYEFAKDCGELAKDEGLKNIWVSNGYMTEEMLSDQKFIDAANIDLKSFDEKFYRQVCGGRLDPILDNLKHMKKKKIWLEITTLVIPGKNDSDDELRSAAKFIADELGKETPWHLSAFHPDYKMTDAPNTPKETLDRAYGIGKEEGLEYIYVGNIDSRIGRDTTCPACGKTLIKRHWMGVDSNLVQNSKCPDCRHKIAGHF